MDWLKLDFVRPRNWITLALCTVPVIALGTAPIPDFYAPHNLVSDGFIPADHTDPNLVNPWGLAFGTSNPVWVANTGTGTSTLYDGLGNIRPLVVMVPPAPSRGGLGLPTGIVANPTSNWMVSQNGKTAIAPFIFATADGTISGWSPTVNATNAIITVDNSASNASYTGLARGSNGTMGLLYAANFNSGKVDVFDNAFQPVTVSGGFVDPNLPFGYAPFNVQNLNGNIYVTYALRNPQTNRAVKKVGLGIVNVFDANGTLIRRVATGGYLNAPWGIAVAPAGFGKFSGNLLIGNFGDGKINAFKLDSYQFRGQFRTGEGQPLVIDGLWGLSFGNGFNSQPSNVLYFTAGPNNETHGIYGTITPHA